MSRRGFFKLARLTLGGMALCVAVSVSFMTVLFWSSSVDAFHRALVCALVLPVLLAGPLFLFISLKLLHLSQLNRELHHAATHDGLTLLLNRGAFTEIVHRRIDEIGHVDGGRGALLLIDADFFKTINDRWGHAMGDETLRQIAARLVEVTRDGDVVGRLGGEEFGVFLPGAGLLSATATAERLRAIISAMDLRGPLHEHIPVSISVGGIFFRNTVSFDQIFQRADRMLYDAKANGRNRVEMDELQPAIQLGNAA